MPPTNDRTALALAELTQGLQALLTAESWLAFLKLQARFHAYSFNKFCALTSPSLAESNYSEAADVISSKNSIRQVHEWY